jgi:ISXO2-like transposase domain
VKSGSHLHDGQWELAAKLFCTRAGFSGTDLAHVLNADPKTGQRLNRILRSMTLVLRPQSIPGVSEWDESIFSGQWVLGGVSRDTKQCLLRCVMDRSERTLCPLVRSVTGAEGLVFTDEWGGYNDLYRHMTVCHAREFVNAQMRFVHTNTQEGIWGHAKTLSWHIYRGFPRRSLPQFLSEIMFRYNVRSYESRVSVLSALLSRKINTVLV